MIICQIAFAEARTENAAVTSRLNVILYNGSMTADYQQCEHNIHTHISAPHVRHMLLLLAVSKVKDSRQAAMLECVTGLQMISELLWLPMIAWRTLDRSLQARDTTVSGVYRVWRCLMDVRLCVTMVT